MNTPTDACTEINKTGSYSTITAQLNAFDVINKRAREDGQWFQDVCEDVFAVSCERDVTPKDLRKITKIQNLF